MSVLAIDTATDRLSVALSRPEGAPLEQHVEGARRHAAELLPVIDALLGRAGLGLAGVTGLALADGPGSFTGLRVGAAVVKALARARPGTPVWTASTLMVRAAGAAAGAPRGARILVVTSALRGELYAACYQFDLPGRVDALRVPGLATPESLHREAPDLLVADVPEKLLNRLTDQFAVPLVRGGAGLPSAAALLSLVGVPGGAERRESLDDWEPEYGRPAEAQARWEAAHGKPLPDPASDAR